MERKRAAKYNIGRNRCCRQNYCDESVRIERNWTKQLIEFFLRQILRRRCSRRRRRSLGVCTCAKSREAAKEAPWLARTASMAFASKKYDTASYRLNAAKGQVLTLKFLIRRVRSGELLHKGGDQEPNDHRCADGKLADNSRGRADQSAPGGTARWQQTLSAEQFA